MTLSTHVTADDVRRMESLISKVPQVDVKTQHNFSGGMYARTIYLDAGTVLVGATHKTDHINIVMGDISVTTDEGMKRLTGYHVLETKAGMKRAGFAHGPTCWTTVCKTEKTEIADAENDLVEEASQLQTQLQIAANTSQKLEG